jgi:hypothetical protein
MGLNVVRDVHLPSVRGESDLRSLIEETNDRKRKREDAVAEKPRKGKYEDNDKRGGDEIEKSSKKVRDDGNKKPKKERHERKEKDNHKKDKETKRRREKHSKNK